MANNMVEKIRAFAVSELEASEREAYVLSQQTEMALRAARDAVGQLNRLIDSLTDESNPDGALAALRTIAGHAGYSNSITTNVNEVTAAAGGVASLLQSF